MNEHRPTENAAASPGAQVPRDAILRALQTALEPLPYVRAAFLGGSDASGRTDRYSDIDLQVIVDDERVEETFAVAHAAIGRLSPIAHRYRLPEPAWHGHSQEFLSLRDADPAHFLDLVVLKKSAKERFLETERHGDPLVLFDKDGIVHADPFDRESHGERMAARRAVLAATFPLFQTLVTRAVRRGFAAEAAAAYQAHAFRPLVEILRMRHCPDRYDYGPRYLDRDLPSALREAVEFLALPPSLDAVEEYRARAEVLFMATLAELEADRA